VAKDEEGEETKLANILGIVRATSHVDTVDKILACNFVSKANKIF